MSAAAALAPILHHLRAGPSRTWSLIVTLYGDAVVPRGGSLWLGTMLEIFAALEIGGNAVRTAVSRLAADRWLDRARLGRNAFYRLGPKGEAVFATAALRIYGAASPAWDGVFHLAVPPPGAGRAGLEEAGYAPLGAGVLLAVAPRPGAGPGAIHLRAHTDAESARRLARQVWPPERLEAGYRRFLGVFAPLQAALAAGGGLADGQALLARLLLIHDYRRLRLRDPMLPDALLAADWPGAAARRLCAGLYAALLEGLERWLDQHGRCEAGALPPAGPDLRARFGADAAQRPPARRP